MSITIQNPKNDKNYLVISTVIVKATTDPHMYVVDNKRYGPVIFDNMNESEVENLVINEDAYQKPLVVKK